MASGSGSRGWGGAGSRIVPAGNGVIVGGTYTPGMTALISITRAASVGVSVGKAVALAVRVAVAVGVLVGLGVGVKVAVGPGVGDGVSDGSTNKVGKARNAAPLPGVPNSNTATTQGINVSIPNPNKMLRFRIRLPFLSVERSHYLRKRRVSGGCKISVLGCKNRI